MKRLIIKILLIGNFAGLTLSPAQAFENLSLALTTEQQMCFSMAMVGMDSVINARLGVPAEHALELASQPVTANAETYDNNLLNVILEAYLWRETPHSYAIKVFYGCAVESSYRKQAKID
ncbi:MAG: hypothetical protein AMJ53_09995 [Gammaproteobacteria bacterium SG8_11]|nr:MAG: hypothetical protein AMJ53_09995 [Gammaproteobacteria bacterium SG8_11]